MTRLLAAPLLVGFGLVGSAQSQQSLNSLSALTVPASALPKGCGLEPAVRPAPSPGPPGGVTVIDVVTGLGFPSNPWSGTERTLVAAVRKAIDGVPPMPDSPGNILEAYRAAYLSAEGARVQVFAVTFNDVKLANPSNPPGSNWPETLSARLVRGATVVKLVSATHPPNWCFDPVQLHIGSVK